MTDYHEPHVELLGSPTPEQVLDKCEPLILNMYYAEGRRVTDYLISVVSVWERLYDRAVERQLAHREAG